jgi:enamine deaminase RidA (YjgF/YER057c/UK114 family)
VTADDRLRALPDALPPPVAPGARIEPWVRSGDLLFLSGQVAADETGALVAHGLVGDQVDLETGRACARRCAVNLLARIREAAGELERVDQVVKLTVFVASAPGFVEQPSVAHAATDLLVEVLGDRGRHARSAIGVAALPLGSPVEVEAIVRLRP